MEILRRISDRLVYHNAVVTRLPFGDVNPQLEELLKKASDLVMTGHKEEAKTVYSQLADMEIKVFEDASTDGKKAKRIRGECGVSAVSALISAHRNDEAKQFIARLQEDPLIPSYAKDRAFSLGDFLVNHPEW